MLNEYADVDGRPAAAERLGPCNLSPIAWCGQSARSLLEPKALCPPPFSGAAAIRSTTFTGPADRAKIARKVHPCVPT